jgi:hypothetical protein
LAFNPLLDPDNHRSRSLLGQSGLGYWKIGVIRSRAEDRANACESSRQILPKSNMMAKERENGDESTGVRSTRQNYQQWLPVEQRRFRSTRSRRKIPMKDGCHGSNLPLCLLLYGLLQSNDSYVPSSICIRVKITELPLLGVINAVE